MGGNGIVAMMALQSSIGVERVQQFACCGLAVHDGRRDGVVEHLFQEAMADAARRPGEPVRSATAAVVLSSMRLRILAVLHQAGHVNRSVDAHAIRFEAGLPLFQSFEVAVPAIPLSPLRLHSYSISCDLPQLEQSMYLGRVSRASNRRRRLEILLIGALCDLTRCESLSLYSLCTSSLPLCPSRKSAHRREQSPALYSTLRARPCLTPKSP
jgi:hypothetical protein